MARWNARMHCLPGRWHAVALSFCLATVLPHMLVSAAADEVEQFYREKTVRVVIGHSAGGGYDLYARLLSKYLRKHIPGQPTIVPQSMTGAGGLRVTNYLFGTAPKDGTVIGTFSRSIPTIPLLTPPGTFDARKFAWLGSMSGETSLCLTGRTSAVKTWQDMLTKPLIMGGQAVGTDSDVYARLYKNVLGAQIRIVSGYPGTTEITLAMERGEVDGICGLSWGTVKVSHPEWRRNKSVNFLLQAGLKKDPDLPEVPFAMDLVKDPEKKQILYLHFAPQAMGRPFAAPPDIPADRKAALIKAFDNAMRDPELLTEATKQRMDIDPMTGRQIDDLLAQIYATPPDVVAKAAQAIAE
jgi:tripartite-type tricarboxylate transporter receptor subunit TctC